MTAKVIKTDQLPIPAGLIGDGIEGFYFEQKKMVIVNGSVFEYNNAPTEAKIAIQRAFANDRESLAYMATKMNIKSANEMFDWWYRCVIGGLDHVADIRNEKLTPDAYNNTCTDTTCRHRGLFCSRASGIRSHEVETIMMLKEGKSMETAAGELCVTLPAVKSRVEKLKEKFNAPNVVALVAIGTQMGI